MTIVDEIPITTGVPLPAAIVALRGRETALALIDQRLADLHGGHSNVLLLDGGPGIGKTRLLDELRRRAGRAGLPVLSAEAVDGQQNVHFAPLLAAMLSAPPSLAELTHVRDLGRRGDLGYWLLHDLGDRLRRAAARTPVVVILDSLQWADSATISAIRVLSADLRDAAVLWALAARRDQARDVLRNLFTHLTDRGADTMNLGGLPAAVVPAMIEDVVSAAAAPRLLELARTADGHPFWLTQLLCGLREEDGLRGDRGPATLPRRITRLMHERLDSLTPQARRVLRMAAVLPPEFAADQLADLMDSHATDLLEPVDEAVRAGLLAVDGTRMRFQPELLRTATRETMPVSLRRALDREAADLLLRAGVNPVEVAAAVAETAQAGDRSAAFVLRAAARTLAASDVGAAADLCIRGFDLLRPHDRERGPTAAEAADLLHRAHRVHEAVLLADRAIAGPLTTGEAELRLTMSSMTARPLADRMRENHLALSLAGVDRPTRARHHVQLAHNLLLAGDHESAFRLVQRMLAGGQEAGDPETDTAARLVLVAAQVARGDASTASVDLSGLPEIAPPPAPGFGNVLAAGLWHCLGRDGEAETVLKACLGQVRRERNGPLFGLVTHVRAQAGLVAGRLAEARADLDSIGPEHEQGWALVLRMVTSAGLAIHLGDRNLGRAATTAAKELRGAETLAERRWANRVLAMAAAERDDVGYACRLLAQDSLTPGTPPTPYGISFLIMAARIAVQALDRDLLERATAAAAALVGDDDAAPAFAAGADHVARLVAGDAPGLLAVADRHAPTRPLLAAAAIEDAARILLNGDRPTAGLEQLNRALDAYTTIGAVADVHRLRRMLRGHGLGRRINTRRPGSGWESLTEAELNVVRIVAAGATNRDAAKRLFLSPHTVNAHLRNAFAKLGITSRVHLANMLRDNDG